MRPVGLEKERRPLGHSGQRRLHAVVGSIDRENGSPGVCLIPRYFPVRNVKRVLPAFTAFLGVQCLNI